MELNRITNEQKRILNEMKENGVTLNRESIIMVKRSAVCHYPRKPNETGDTVGWIEDAGSEIQKMGSESMDVSDLIAASLILINGVLNHLDDAMRDDFRNAVKGFVDEGLLSRNMRVANAIGMAVQPPLIKVGITQMGVMLGD